MLSKPLAMMSHQGLLNNHRPYRLPQRHQRMHVNQSLPRQYYNSSQEALNASRTSLDNLSIGSHSSAGFFIPMSQSPSGQSGTQSPGFGQSPDDRVSQFSGLDNRPSTPLNFPLTMEDSVERAPTPKRGPQRKISRNISFNKLFPHSTQQGPMTGQQELREKACEYCLRVLEQNERKPTKVQDAILLEATVIEAVYTLDLLCRSDKSLVPKLIEMIRRLYGRITSDMNKWKRVMLPVVQFFLNHGEAVVFDAEPACKMLFGNMLNAYYYSSAFAFEVVMLCLGNKEKLCLSTSIFTKFFPNLFKILAWYPRTFLREFIELLPVMMSEDSAVEIFHSLLDLSCLAAAICTFWNARGKSSSITDSPTSVPSSSDAFTDPKYKPLFSFILRPEAGHGDTISRLGSLHSLLVDMVEHPRVIVSSQIITTLLSTYFRILLEESDRSIVSRLVPVILERSTLLYNVQNSEIQIRRLLAEKLVLMFQTYPSLVATHQQDIVEFIAGMKNLGPEKEEFFINLVWSIGEYVSIMYEKGCTVQMTVQYFESLEALTYEIMMQSAPGKVPFTGKLISVLMTALAKLASRCQDLVQRAILCCSKIVRQKPEMLSDPESYQDLLIRAQELINLLKLPNVAPVILSPQADWVTGRWHRDKNASLPLLLQATKVIVS